MPLQGSLDSFALSDVLSLLASTAKSGELRVQGPRKHGVVWLRQGELASTQSGQTTDPVDVLFELLRLDGGDFTFNEGEPEAPDGAQPVMPLLELASQRLEEWLVIAEVVPSLSVRCALREELEARTVTLTAERWKAIVAVSAGRSVGDMAHRLNLGEFDACKLAKELVDDGLVEVTGEDPAPVDEPAVEEPVPVAAVIDEVASLMRDGADAEVEADADVELFAELDDPVDADAEGDDELDEVPVAVGVPAGVEGEADAAPETAGDGDPLSALSEAVGRISELPPPAELDEVPGAEALEGQFPEGVEMEGDEPINRGLLLKFLSSVRS